MAKKSYCGINNIALIIPDKGYGGSPNGKAWKLVKGYCGDENEIAQQFWPSAPGPDYDVSKYHVGQTYTFKLEDLEKTWNYATYAYVKMQEDYGTGDWLYRIVWDILQSDEIKDAVFEKINEHSVDFNGITLNIIGSGIDRRPREEDSSYIRVRIMLDRFSSVQGTILEKANAFGFDYCTYRYVTSHRYYMEVMIRASSTEVTKTISDISTSTNGNIYVGVYGYGGAGGNYYPYLSLSNIGLDLKI